MSDALPGFLARLPTPAKILLIMTLALLPLGLASAWLATRALESANNVIESRAHDQAQVATGMVGHLLRRNQLALRIAANAALADGTADACVRTQRILAVVPEVAREFSLFDTSGRQLCTVGQMGYPPPVEPLAPGAFQTWIAPDNDALFLRSGVIGGRTGERGDAAGIGSQATAPSRKDRCYQATKRHFVPQRPHGADISQMFITGGISHAETYVFGRHCDTRPECGICAGAG